MPLPFGNQTGSHTYRWLWFVWLALSTLWSALSIASTPATTFGKGGLPVLTVAAISNGGVGSFVFTGNNGWTTQTIVTTTAGVSTPGTPQTLAAAGVSTSITASAPPGFLLTGAACNGMGTGGSAILAGNTLTLDTAATAFGAVIGCTLTFTRLPTLTLTAISNGGVGSFLFTGTNGWANQTITTTTPGVGVSGASQVLSSPGVASTITAGTPIGYLLSGASCTGMGSGGTATLVGNSLTLNAAATAAGANISCTFIVAKQPTLTLTAISNGGVGSFVFAGTNGWSGQTITTTIPGVGVAGATQVLASPGTSTAITANLPPGYVLVGASCTGMGSGGTANLVGNTISLNSAATAPGATISCTTTFTKLPTVTLVVISNGGVGAFTFAGTNGWVNQTITTTVSGAGVAGATQTLVSAGTATSISQSAPPGFTLVAASCTGLGSGGAASLLGNAVTLDPAATAAGANIVCTVTNELPPSVTISDVIITEGNGGATNAVFAVNLSMASGQTVSVTYSTADGTAAEPSDYTNTSGTLMFAPGQTSQNVSVPVIGETLPEANETFFVNLSGAVNATITDSQGVATISNDDVPITVNPATLPNGMVATPYNQLLTANGGSGPYLFAVTVGALPAGLTLSPGGLLSGTPTAGGSFTITVAATDGSPAPGPYTGSRVYTFAIDPPMLTLPVTNLAGGVLGQSYSAAIAPATGGTAPYQYAVTNGALPGGLTLDALTGAITGNPNALGTTNFSVTATDDSTGTGPYSVMQTYSIAVVDVPTIANALTITVPYDAATTNVPLNITGGAATSVAVATGPSHGTANAAGITMTYQPTVGFAGSDSFTYTASNSAGTSLPATVNVTVADPIVTITPSGGFTATAGTPYNQTFTFGGGAPPWSSYQVSTLPAGVAITGTTSNTVTISGTPSEAGTFNLNVSATDSSTGNGPFTVLQTFALNVSPPTLTLNPSNLPNGTAGVAYNQSIAITGGVAPYTVTPSGVLPTGITFDAMTHTFSGTPTQSGSFNVSVTATDSTLGIAGTVTGVYTLVIGVPTLSLTPTAGALPAGVGGTAYSQTFAASGGVGPYTYSPVAGAVPSGLALNTTTGVLSGIPTVAGNFNFSIRATDSTSGTAATITQTYTLAITAPTISIGPAILPNGVVSMPYNQQLSATGGTTPYAFAVSAGTLPAGLSLSSNGLLSGTPSLATTANFTITVTDALGFMSSATYTMGPLPAPRAVPVQNLGGLLLMILTMLSIGLLTFGQTTRT
ncbi:beta strand repeat-containing protein [Ahniella affigens]|nr:putative Ig domain-containing protein [Ahniella affigens]